MDASLIDAQKSEIARSDTWKPPDFRSLIHAAGTEAGKSELSCVLDDTTRLVMAHPMIFSDETRPTDYTFANKVTAQVQTDSSKGHESTPDELTRSLKVICGLRIWRSHLRSLGQCQLFH